MSNLTEHAKSELTRVGLLDKNSDYGGMLGESVLKLIEQFADAGHSGYSASVAISMFERLARFQPLSPLTGDDDEWVEHASDSFQNRRCSTVFKDGKDAPAYNIDGRVFRKPGDLYFTNSESRVPVTFPYTPSTEYVDVPAERQDAP
jgi:hypothetical protein